MLQEVAATESVKALVFALEIAFHCSKSVPRKLKMTVFC